MNDQVELSMRDKDVRKRFFWYLSAFVLITFLIISALLLGRRNQLLRDYKVHSETQVDHLGGLIESHFQSIKSDILFLPVLNEILRFKSIPNEEDKHFIEKEFLEFVRSKKIYDQIRYLDTEGNELLRINFNNGFPEIVSREELQNKSNRYYFKETVKLKEGQVYVSPIDLNKEKGVVEVPLKPMIRFGTPLYDQQIHLKGVLILNYLADVFIEDLIVSSRNEAGTFGLINEEGFWLYNDNPSEEWQFMYPERNPSGLMVSSPELWEKIVSNDRTHSFIHENSLYTSLNIQPLSQVPTIVNEQHWYLVNRVSFDEMNTSWRDFLIVLFLSTFILTLMASFPFLLAAKTVVQRNLFKEALERAALFDTLTGLPNRDFLKIAALQLIKDLDRYNQTFALLFIDLDGFKNVNDTYGHEGGDLVLKDVAGKLKNCVRDSDTVARIGGDEFVVLLHRVEGEEDCKMVARNILDSLKQALLLPQGEAKVGSSIGIALALPGTVPDLESLIARADKAMYKVKDEGKGDFKIG
jgi:diguanylate cyclase (GGDEF)-like protein